MTIAPRQSNDALVLVHDFVTASLEGCLSDAQFVEFEQALRDRPEVLDVYLDYIEGTLDLAGLPPTSKSDDLTQPANPVAAPETNGFRHANNGRTAPLDTSIPAILPLPLSANLETLGPPIVGSGGNPTAPASAPSGSLGGWISSVFPSASFSPLLLGIGFVAALGTFALMALAFLRGPVAGGKPAIDDHLAPTQAVAHLMMSPDCRWADPSLKLDTGVGLAAGRTLDLASGTIELTFACGAVVTIQGPAVVTLDSDKSLFLAVGRVMTRARVATAKGFQVRTPTAHVVDLGTEFSTQVSPEGRSEIYVCEGSVDVQVATGGGGPGLVRAGNSVLIEPGPRGVLARVEEGDGTPAFRFPTIEPPSTAAYSDVSRGLASIRVVEGHLAPNSASESVLIRGHGQNDGDSPEESAFFHDNVKVGRILMDLGKPILVRQINTYSWHDFRPVAQDYNVRAVQRYTLYGASGETPPATSGDDLVGSGWTLIDRVNTDEFFTVPPVRNRPSQQGVAISAAKGPLGRYRYLLWDVRPTHRGSWSFVPDAGEYNTFFGKFDVYAEGDSAEGGPRLLGEPNLVVRIEGGDGTPAFRFRTIEPPSTAAYSDASRGHASVRVVDGKLAPNSGPLSVLLRGHGQSVGNSPAESAFFLDNWPTGRILMDLGKQVNVRQINTYSWCDFGPAPQDYHVRAAQRYLLYGTSGDKPPETSGDPVDHDWTLIARVNTDEFFGVPPPQNRPMQQAVAISAARGSLGSFRYLLWSVRPTHRESYAGRTDAGEDHTYFGKFDVYTDQDSAISAENSNTPNSDNRGP